MTKAIEPIWTLDELGAQVALVLAVDYAGAPNGRVRDVPDRRTIRYYTTLGLLDRPAEMRGRTAWYGRRHLLQLVSIKRMQARGLSLAEIQQRLVGLTDGELSRLAELPAGWKPEKAKLPLPARAGRAATAFWRAAPAPVAEAVPADAAVVLPAASTPEEVSRSYQGISLSAEVTLLFPALRPIHADDLEALRIAAAPLLKLLEARRLLSPRQA
jgi:DNA-binding transcriptional MerR regulator